MKNSLKIIVLLISLLLTVTVSNADQFYSVDVNSDELVIIDSNTESVTVIGSLEYDVIYEVDLVMIGNQLYALDNKYGEKVNLLKIDTNSGKVTSIKELVLNGVSPKSAESLAYLHGKMYLMFNPNHSASSSYLGEIDDEGQIVNSFSLSTDGDGLCSDGTYLYNTDGIPGSNLVKINKINPTTGEISNLFNFSYSIMKSNDCTIIDSLLYSVDHSEERIHVIDLKDGGMSTIMLDNNGSHFGLSPLSAYENINSGLISYYPFNSNADDESGHNKHGTVYGATLVDDRYGNSNSAYSFDGIDDYINISNFSIDFDFTTVSYWIKTTKETNNYAVFKIGSTVIGNNVGGLGAAIGATIDGQPADVIKSIFRDQLWSSGTYPYLLSANGMADGNWHQVTFVYDGDASLYVDGNLVAQEARGSKLTHISGTILRLGHITHYERGQYHFNGVIDDFRIYNRALTPYEIFNLYLSGSSLNPDFGLVAHYPFDGNANDIIGGNNGHDDFTGVMFVPGVSGDAAYFDGIDDHITIQNTSDLAVGTGDYSLSTWFRSESSSDGKNKTAFHISDASGGNRIQWGYHYKGSPHPTDGSVVFEMMSGGHSTQLYWNWDVSEQNQWHLLTVVREDTTNLEMYIDGELKDQINDPSLGNVAIHPGNNLFIGEDNHYTTANISGELDDLRIYNRALTEFEIQQLYFDSKPKIQDAPAIPHQVDLDSIMKIIEIHDNAKLIWDNFSDGTLTNTLTTTFDDILNPDDQSKNLRSLEYADNIRSIFSMNITNDIYENIESFITFLDSNNYFSIENDGAGLIVTSDNNQTVIYDSYLSTADRVTFEPTGFGYNVTISKGDITSNVYIEKLYDTIYPSLMFDFEKDGIKVKLTLSTPNDLTSRMLGNIPNFALSVTFPLLNETVTITINHPTAITGRKIKVGNSINCQLEAHAKGGAGAKISGSGYLKFDDQPDLNSYLKETTHICLDDFSNLDYADLNSYAEGVINSLTTQECFEQFLEWHPTLGFGVGGKIGIGAGVGGDACVAGVGADGDIVTGGVVKIESPLLESLFENGVPNEYRNLLVSISDLAIDSTWLYLGIKKGINIKEEDITFDSLIGYLRTLGTAIGSSKAFLKWIGDTITDEEVKKELLEHSKVKIFAEVGIDAELEILLGASVGSELAVGGYLSLKDLLDLILFEKKIFDDAANHYGTIVKLDGKVGGHAGLYGWSIGAEQEVIKVDFEPMHNLPVAQNKLFATENEPYVVNATIDSESLPDNNDDSMYDSITVNGTLDSAELGNYKLAGFLYSDTNCVGYADLVMNNISQGTHPFSLIFDGLGIRNEGHDGPYTISLYVYDANEEIVFQSDALYTISNVAFNDFESSTVSLDSVTFSGVDNNLDGFFEYLKATLDITSALSSEIFITGNSDLLGITSSLNFDLIEGNNQIEIVFDGKQIRKSGLNSPYDFTFFVRDSQGELLSEQTATASDFLVDSFAMPNAILTDSFSSTPVDLNSNGLFDQLVFNVGINVQEAGLYEIDVLIEGGGESFTLTKELHLSPSTTFFPVDLDGKIISKFPGEKSFVLRYLELRESSTGEVLGERINAYTSLVYNSLDFESDGLQLTGVYKYQELDSDFDGKFDSIKLSTGTKVHDTGAYRLKGIINCGEYSYEVESSFLLSVLDDEISHEIDTDQFFILNYNGQCTFDQIRIINSEGYHVDLCDQGCLSFNYDSSMFNTPCRLNIDGDNRITVSDAVLGLQVISGQTPNYLNFSDCNDDNLLGMPELLSILKELSLH